MTELPERLRELAEALTCCEWEVPLCAAADCVKAADEIERLRAANEILGPNLCDALRERDECRRLLRFVIDNSHSNAGNTHNPFTWIDKRKWDEFEQAAKAAGGGDEV